MFAALLSLLAVSLACCRGKKGDERSGGDEAATDGSEGSGRVSEIMKGMDIEIREGEGAKKEKNNKKKKEKKVFDDSVTQVEVPAGQYIMGSKTGECYRNPAKELDAFEVDVKTFKIDRYPYPNEKGRKPHTGVTFEEAGSLCEKEGKRLCTELEWEVACKGLDNEQYPDGNVSPFGMEGMFKVFEWTGSQWLEPELSKPRGVVVKGNTTATIGAKPRCAYRSVRQPEKSTSNVGFRCCLGEVNEMNAMLEPLKKPFEEVKDFPPDKFQLLVKSTPEMKKVSKDPRMFGEKDLDYVLLRRKIDVDKSYAGYIFTCSPVWWRPVRGEELLVMAGYSGKHSFVLALYHLGGGKFKHASSLILLESEAATVQLPIPLILVTGVDRTVINWAPCWNCSEGGSLYIDDKFDSGHEGNFLVHLSYRWGP